MDRTTESQSVLPQMSNDVEPSSDKKSWMTPTVTESSLTNKTLGGFSGGGEDNGFYS